MDVHRTGPEALLPSMVDMSGETYTLPRPIETSVWLAVMTLYVYLAIYVRAS